MWAEVDRPLCMLLGRPRLSEQRCAEPDKDAISFLLRCRDEHCPRTRILASHPQVILREQDVPYVEAIEPALRLLGDVAFTSANTEFLTALADYRSGDYEDCVAKCGSAFESTMKLICEERGWPYNLRRIRNRPAESPVWGTAVLHFVRPLQRRHE
jgi:hypothetical protein